MGDFAQIVKGLDIVRASKDTTVNTKPLSLFKSRPIKKLYKQFTIPAFFKQVTAVDYRRRLVAQFNCTMDKEFYITHIPGPFLITQHPIITISWRYDVTVFRYILFEDWRTYPSGFIRVDPYNKELIPKYFRIEYWKNHLNEPFCIMPEWTFTTSLYYNPTSADQTEIIDTTGAGTVVSQELFQPSNPEAIPTTYGEISAWKNNV